MGQRCTWTRRAEMDNIGSFIVPVAIALFAISIVARGIRIVQQAQTMIIERLGKYHRTLSSGVNLIIPIIDKPRAIDWHQVIVTPAGDSFARHFRTDKIDLRETVYVFPRQNVITKDNVDWASGAAMLVRRAAVAVVGGMDEAYFMFNEDVDWCRRMNLAGWSVDYVPAAELVHEIGASHGAVSNRVILERHKGMIHYYRKHHPVP